MSKPKNTTSRTYVATGRLHHTTNAHQVLHHRRITAGILHDAALQELAANHAGQAMNTNQALKLATIVANHLGIPRGPLNNRCRIAVIGNAWNNHVNHDAGLPQQPTRPLARNCK